MFGINPGEFALIAVVALIVIGPERLPKYAETLGGMVRRGRTMATGLREQVREEIGPEFDDVDWRKLDPRQYDPRRIVKEALSDTFEDVVPTKPVSKKVSTARSTTAGTTAASVAAGSSRPAVGSSGAAAGAAAVGPDPTERSAPVAGGATGTGTGEDAAPFDDDAT